MGKKDEAHAVLPDSWDQKQIAKVIESDLLVKQSVSYDDGGTGVEKENLCGWIWLKEHDCQKKLMEREPFRIYRASITVEAALLYPILIFLLMFLLQKTITYYQQTDQAAQGIISVEEPDTSKMFWKIVLAQRVTEEIKEKAGLQEDNVYEN